MATNHKYISRKMKNGRYVYIYPKDEVTLKPGDIGYRGDGSESYVTSESSVKLQTKIYNLKKKIKAAAEKARKAYTAAKAKLASAKDTKTYKRLKAAAQKAKTAFNNFKKRYKTASSLEKKVTKKTAAKDLNKIDLNSQNAKLTKDRNKIDLNAQLKEKQNLAYKNNEGYIPPEYRPLKKVPSSQTEASELPEYIKKLRNSSGYKRKAR